MKNLTNIGVQLMPNILIIASVLFYSFEAKAHSLVCMIMAFVMWIVLFPENK